MKGIGGEKISDNFIKRWKEMLEYALTSEKWNPSTGYRRYYLNELWSDLLGMNYMLSSFWGEDKKTLLVEIKTYYERWAKISLANTDSASKFIVFLTHPATEEMLYDGLIWINKASTETGDDFFSDSHNNIQKYLAELLEISWKIHKDRIRNNGAVFEAFKSLLRKLVDLQNIQAIEIQQNLV